METKEERITFMNAMAHAVNIVIHNSKGAEIDPKDVIKMARKLAFVAMNPQISKVAEEIK